MICEYCRKVVEITITIHDSVNSESVQGLYEIDQKICLPCFQRRLFKSGY